MLPMAWACRHKPPPWPWQETGRQGRLSRGADQWGRARVLPKCAPPPPAQGPEHMGVGSLVLELGPHRAALPWGSRLGHGKRKGVGVPW